MYAFILTIIALVLVECIVSYVAITIGNDAVEKAEESYLRKCRECDWDDGNYRKMKDIENGMTNAEFMRKYCHYPWDKKNPVYLSVDNYCNDFDLDVVDGSIGEFLDYANCRSLTVDSIIKEINRYLSFLTALNIYFDGADYIIYRNGLKFVCSEFWKHADFICVGTI